MAGGAGGRSPPSSGGRGKPARTGCGAGSWEYGGGSGRAAIAAVLLGVVVTASFHPDLLPGPLRPKPVEIVRTVEKVIEKEVNPGRFVAVLQPNAASPAFILTVDVATRTASVRRV